MASVICVGHSALDRVFTVESWPQASAKVRARSYMEVGGGMGANAAAAIARLGAEVQFWGPVGSDSVADVMRAKLQAVGVDVRYMRRFDGLSSSTSAILQSGGGPGHGKLSSTPPPTDSLPLHSTWPRPRRWPNSWASVRAPSIFQGEAAFTEPSISP